MLHRDLQKEDRAEILRLDGSRPSGLTRHNMNRTKPTVHRMILENRRYKGLQHNRCVGDQPAHNPNSR